MRWKWGESRRDPHKVVPRGAPFAALSHRGCLGGHPAGDARFAPHTWERTLARCVIGKRGLRLGRGPFVVCTRQGRQQMYPESGGAPTPVSVYPSFPGLAKFTEMKWDQPGIKRTTNLFDLGEFFSLKTTYLFPGVILAFGFAVLAQSPCLLRTSWLKAGTGGL